MRSKTLGFLCAFIALGSGFPKARAADFWSPRAASMGGAGYAAPLLNDAIYLNPSYAAFLPTYAISANGGWYTGGTEYPDGSHDIHGRNLNASIQDGRSDLFQAGVAYTIREDAKVISIGAGRNVVQRMGVGIGTKIIFPNDASPGRIVDAVLSTSYIVNDWIQASLVIDNLFESADSRARNIYRDFIVGSKFNLSGIMLVYFDPHLTPNVVGSSAYGHQAALEFPFFSDFFFRIGNFHNTYVPYLASRADGYSVGVGWVGPRLSLDYAISRPIDPVAVTMHLAGFTIYF